MKTILFVSLLCLSLNALADSYVTCSLKGVSDNDIVAPKYFTLSEANGWHLNVDKKKVSEFDLKEVQPLILTYTKDEAKYRYSIDDSQCEDAGVGTASLLMTSSWSRSSAVYICECAVD